MAANNVLLTGDGIRGKSGKNTVGLAPGFPCKLPLTCKVGFSSLGMVASVLSFGQPR